MKKPILCPYQIGITCKLVLSRQNQAAIERANDNTEYCLGTPECPGPIKINSERSGIAGFLLGRISTEEVCPVQSE